MLMNNLRNFPPVTLGIFQSTLLQEERLKLKYIQNGNSYFNPRSYKRSDIVGICLCVGYVVFQSTLLQEERQNASSVLFSTALISIHAPTRGATTSCTLSLIKTLFQSTLLQEERLPSPYRHWFSARFQSTLLQEERLDCRHKYINMEEISIHAPTRGATQCFPNWIFLHLFQSTLLQEERQITLIGVRLFINFNPRSYKRSDSKNAQ